MIFGNKSKFAVEFIETRDGLDRANIYVSGKNVTPIDNSHYKLAVNLSSEASHFSNASRWARKESEFPKESVDAVFHYINERELRFTYRVLDWGPPTDDCFFLVAPFEGKLYLYGELDGVKAPFGTEIEPLDIANILMQAERHITNCSI